MKKMILFLIIILPGIAFGSSQKVAPDHKGDQIALSKLISTFDILNEPTLQIELMNMNGVKKTENLATKMEEYQEYTRYSFKNPFGNANEESKKNEKYNLELYIFDKIKPSLQETKDLNASDSDVTDLRVDLMVLMDAATKKTLKVKAKFYYKDFLIADGNVDNNSPVKITDDLNSKLKSCKIQELRVVRNLLGSDKRSLDLQIKFTQGEKQIKENLNINLLDMKQTPLNKKTENDLEEDQETEGNENETTTDRS
jgi:hypothetical protein